MVMTSLCRVTTLATIFLVLGVGIVVVADQPDSKKQRAKAPNASRVFRDAVRKLDAVSRQSGYRVQCDVQGGLSKKANHKVWMYQVYEQHQGQVRGDLMYMPEMMIYRNPQKGAILIGEYWMPLFNDPAAERIQRIIAFPAQVLLDALSGKAKVEWIEPPEKIDINDPDYVEPMDAPLEPDEGGGTAVVEKKQPSYRRIRVEAGEKVAVHYFNQIQNSGLLGGSL
jgi:hypothetical protein